MIQYFNLSQNSAKKLEVSRLAQLPEDADLSPEDALWINLEDPDAGELKHVRDSFGIPENYLEDPLDPAERARAAHNQDNILVIAIASVYPKGGPEPGHEERDYQIVPVGIILAPGLIVTVCRRPGLVVGLLDKGMHKENLRNEVCLALNLLEKISTRYIEDLQELDEVSNQIEESMRKSTSNQDLHRILQLAKTLVYFLNSLKGNDMVLDKLLNSKAITWTEDEKEKLTDVMIECRQAMTMAEIYTQIIANMSDIYASMISNNMNRVVKLLTAITVILTAPTIISGLYGMNVPLPLEDSPLALPAIIGGTGLVCWLLWRLLSKKNWL